MDSKTAKRIAKQAAAELEYDKDDKVWNLVTSNSNVTCLTSSELKALSKEDLMKQIAALEAPKAKRRGRKPFYPVRVRPSRDPVNVTPLKVIMPNGETTDGVQNSNYFFVRDHSNLKSIRKDWPGVPERYDAEKNLLDLRHERD